MNTRREALARILAFPNQCKHCGHIQQLDLIGDSKVRFTEWHAWAYTTFEGKSFPGCKREKMNGVSRIIEA
jgi:hypothetical protein